MKIYETRKILKEKRLEDLNISVTFYARVSTEKDTQLNSLQNQIDYYKNKIKSNPNWTYVDGYIDEGISGMGTEKRERFNQMIEDAKAGKFDFIITKEISRFARNTIDSLTYTRNLLSYGVAIWFENDGLNTIDDDSEFRLAIMSGVAQDEIRKLSSRIRFGHAQAIKNGVVIGNSRIMGYKKNHGKLVIDETQVDFIVRLFELYASNKYSMKQIEDIFYAEGFRNSNGNKFSHTTMANVIRNPKYKGYYVGNKVKIVDMFTKEQKFLPESEWVMYKDETGETVPAIVSEELWDEANRVLKIRSDVVVSKRTSIKTNNLYTGLLYCKEHNVPLYKKQNIRNDKKSTYDPFWVCSHRIKNGRDSCSLPPIYEEEIKKILIKMLVSEVPKFNDVIDEYFSYLNSSDFKSQVQSKITQKEEQVSQLSKKKDKLLDLALDNRMSNDEFEKRNNLFNSEIAGIEKEIKDLAQKLESQKAQKTKLVELQQNIKQLVSSKNVGFQRETLAIIIERIYFSFSQDGKLIVEIILKTGTALDIEYDKARDEFVCRSGQMVKKMCPEQHITLTRNSMTNLNHYSTIECSCKMLMF